MVVTNGRVFKNEMHPHYHQLFDLLEKLSIKYKVGTDAIALRFIIDFLEPNIILSGASKKDQLKQNLECYKFQLTNNELTQFQSLMIDPKNYWEERFL